MGLTRVFSIVLLMAANAIAQSPTPTFPNPGKVSMSRQDQEALGKKAAAEVYQQMPVLPDSSPETQYVRQIGQKLVATIPVEYSWPFDFHTVAQKEINAFALPGGPMFINIGTITASANEAQLAGVMAHEMSHVIMQHSAKQAGKAQTTTLLAGIASSVLGGVAGDKGGGLVGQLGEMGIQMGAQGLMMKYSRGDESQADSVGAVILYKAGYNPQALADFFKTLEQEGGGSPPQFFSDHPNPGNREQAIQKEIAEWPREDYSGDSPAFLTTRQHAAGVKAYTAQEIAQGAKSGQWTAMNKQNGATFTPAGTPAGAKAVAATTSGAPGPADGGMLKSVLPSGQMVASNLGTLTIQRPDNWELTMPVKAGQFATIAPRAGVTEKGVGYGVLVNGVPAQPGGRVNIDDMTARVVKQMQESNGLEPSGAAQVITAGGIQGRAITMHSASPFLTSTGEPQLEKDWLVTVPQRDGSTIVMIFIAPQAQFEQFQPTYDAMLKTAQFP